MSVTKRKRIRVRASVAALTRGLLKRASVFARELRYTGQETDRRWEQGEDVSLLEFAPMELRPSGMVVADSALREQMRKHGIRELIRKTGLSQHTIETILAGQPVRVATLKRGASPALQITV